MSLLQASKKDSLKAGSLYSVATRSGRKSLSRKEKRKELIKRLNPSSKDTNPNWVNSPRKGNTALVAEARNDATSTRSSLSAEPVHQDNHRRHDTESRRDASCNEVSVETIKAYGPKKVTASSKVQQMHASQARVIESLSNQFQQLEQSWDVPQQTLSEPNKSSADSEAMYETDQENQSRRMNEGDKHRVAKFLTEVDSVLSDSDDSFANDDNASSKEFSTMDRKAVPNAEISKKSIEVSDDNEHSHLMKDMAGGLTPTQSNLRQRYEHLAANNDKSEGFEPTKNRSGQMHHPFAPLSISFDSNKDEVHQANEQKTAADVFSPLQQGWSWDEPFDSRSGTIYSGALGSQDSGSTNSQYSSQFSPSDELATTASTSIESWPSSKRESSETGTQSKASGSKRALWPLHSPRKPKSPRSKTACVDPDPPSPWVVDQFSALSVDSSHSSELEMEKLSIRSPPLAGKIANAFRSLRATQSEEKKAKVPIHHSRRVSRSPTKETDKIQSVSASATYSKEEEDPIASFSVRSTTINAEVVTTAQPSHEEEEEQEEEADVPVPILTSHRGRTWERRGTERRRSSRSKGSKVDPTAREHCKLKVPELSKPPCTTSAPPTFDIKVAVLGSKKAGKSTILNALFQEQFSCTNTTTVDHFSLSQSKSRGQTMHHVEDADDVVLVGKSGKEVKERFFDVELENDLLGEMRDDARLVFVDLPGIFPNGSHYLDYAERKWEEMDCVVVVLDAMNENAKEHNKVIMNFVKHCLKRRKELPIIILCNKVDDTEDEELMAMVDKMRKEALAVILGDKSTEKAKNQIAFIPISAKYASWFRAASRLPFEDFKRFNNKAMVDEIGRDELGRFRWKKLTRDEQYQAIYDVVTDPEELEVRLRASNFDILLNTFDHFLGGKKTQGRLIRKQFEASLQKLSSQPGFCGRLESIYQRSLVLGKPTDHLKETFWSLYTKSYNEAFSNFKKNPMEIASLHGPMKELSQYATGLHETLHNIDPLEVDSHDDALNEKSEDIQKITNYMKEAIRRQCGLVVEKAYQWIQARKDDDDEEDTSTTSLPEHWSWEEKKKRWRNKYTDERREGTKDANPALKMSSWDDMTPRDWVTVIDSIMIMAYNRQFCENFGGQITELKWLDRKGKFADFTVKSEQKAEAKQACSTDEDLEIILGGVLDECTSEETMALQQLTRITVPDSPSDPEHWGHLIWMFSRHMDSKALGSSHGNQVVRTGEQTAAEIDQNLGYC